MTVKSIMFNWPNWIQCTYFYYFYILFSTIYLHYLYVFIVMNSVVFMLYIFKHNRFYIGYAQYVFLNWIHGFIKRWGRCLLNYLHYIHVLSVSDFRKFTIRQNLPRRKLPIFSLSTLQLYLVEMWNYWWEESNV